MSCTEQIIEQYRARYGQSLPVGAQYWSMAGHCEIDQLRQSGLIQPSQFHGVEIKHDIHKRNAAAYPEAYWHRGDFYRVMAKASGLGKFKPAIVNVNPLQRVENAGLLISDLMMLLTGYPDVMLVANFMLGTQHGNHVIAELNKLPNFQAFNEHWDFDNGYYEYTGKAQTTMGMFVFNSMSHATAA